MNRRTTGIVVTVFIALLVVLFWQRARERESAQATPTPGQEFLFDLDANITGLRVERVGEEFVELTLDQEGLWKLTWPEGEETDVVAVESAIAQLPTLSVLSALEEQRPELKAVGLAKPVYKILILLGDGNQIVAYIGDETPTGAGYYVLISGRPLYVVNKSSLDSVLKLVDTPPIKPTPTPTPEPEATPEG